MPAAEPAPHDRARSLPAAARPPVRLVAGSTVVEFTRDGDRWRHVVVTATGRWNSLEGEGGAGADPRWPASPAIVEVSVVDLAAGPVILGVGLAGRSHFSLSVRACPQSADTVLFEAACRIHEPAAWLGSTYRGGDGRVVPIAAGPAPPPATVAWSYAIGPGGVGPACPPSPPAGR